MGEGCLLRLKDFFIKSIIYIAIILIILIIIGAIFLPSIGSFVQSNWNNTAIEMIGQSNTVNATGVAIISFGETLRWFLIILAVIVEIVLICIVVINKRRRQKRIIGPPYDDD